MNIATYRGSSGTKQKPGCSWLSMIIIDISITMIATYTLVPSGLAATTIVRTTGTQVTGIPYTYPRLPFQLCGTIYHQR